MDREILKWQANRFRLLLAAYKYLEADTARWVDMKQLAGNLGGQFDPAFRYLLDEGLMRPYGRGCTASLTHAGIKAIEAAFAQPDRPTACFPAVDSIQLINSGTAEKL